MTINMIRAKKQIGSAAESWFPSKYKRKIKYGLSL